MAVIERYCQQCGAAYPPTTAICAVCGISLKATVQLDDEMLAFASSELRLQQLLHTRQPLNGRYRIVRQVGMGGFGAVYEAEDTLEQRPVAIKEIGLTGLSAQQTIEATGSFNREVQMLSTLLYPGIPRMYEQLTDAGHWYLVMEFIAGETLEELLGRAEDGHLPLEQALRIGIQLCTILGYLHSQQPPVVFRDLKPTNVMLTPGEKVYLIDFGVARLYRPDKLRDTVAFGSPGYAAPEQYGRAQTTPRADIYSLGALLHQILTGRDPSSDPFHFQPLRTCDSSLPFALEKLVARMLAEDREQRPADIGEVGSRLREIANSRALRRQHKMMTQRKEARRPVDPHPSAFSTIGMTVFIYRGHQLPINALAWSPNGRVLASCDNGWDLRIWDAFPPSSSRSGHAQVHDLAWSPNGRVLALAGEDHVVRLWHLGTYPRWWRMVAILLGSFSYNYEGHSSPVMALCWSPDGQMIASAEAKGMIHLWNARTHKLVLVYQGHAESVEHIVWSPDGTRIASCSTDRMVRVWQASSGDGRWKWRTRGSGVRALAWSPDGRYLACGAGDKTVHVWDIAQNRRLYVYRAHRDTVKSLAWSPDGSRIASTSSDGVVHVWSALNGQDAFLYRGHGESVTAVAWSPDGLHLASGGAGTVVHIWRAV